MTDKKNKSKTNLSDQNESETQSASVTEKALAPKSPSSLNKNDPFYQYMQQVSQYPILTPEEEKEIAEHYKEYNDKDSAQKLVLSNLRLVVKIAFEYRSAYYNLLDLIQEGNMGLMRAVQKFDVDRGVRFASYAAWWVRAFILKYILDNFRLVKVGTTQAQKKLFFNLMKEKEKIEKLGFKATPKLLSENLDVKEKEVVEMQKRMGMRDMELDAPRKNYEGALNMDFISSESDVVDAEERVEQKELHEILLNNLGEFTRKLNDKEQEIFTERLFSEMPKTLQEIADQYGITRERVRQIESKLIKKMQTYFKDKGLDLHPSQKS